MTEGADGCSLVRLCSSLDLFILGQSEELGLRLFILKLDQSHAWWLLNTWQDPWKPYTAIIVPFVIWLHLWLSCVQHNEERRPVDRNCCSWECGWQSISAPLAYQFYLCTFAGAPRQLALTSIPDEGLERCSLLTQRIEGRIMAGEAWFAIAWVFHIAVAGLGQISSSSQSWLACLKQLEWSIRY